MMLHFLNFLKFLVDPLFRFGPPSDNKCQIPNALPGSILIKGAEWLKLN